MSVRITSDLPPNIHKAIMNYESLSNNFALGVNATLMQQSKRALMNAHITSIEKALMSNFAAFQTKGDRRKSVAALMRRLRANNADEADIDQKILMNAKAAMQLKAI